MKPNTGCGLMIAASRICITLKCNLPIHDKILMPQNQKVGFEAFLFKKYTNLLVRDTNLIAKLLNLLIDGRLLL